jgi:hypothetical protein
MVDLKVVQVPMVMCQRGDSGWMIVEATDVSMAVFTLGVSSDGRASLPTGH